MVLSEETVKWRKYLYIANNWIHTLASEKNALLYTVCSAWDSFLLKGSFTFHAFIVLLLHAQYIAEREGKKLCLNTLLAMRIPLIHTRAKAAFLFRENLQMFFLLGRLGTNNRTKWSYTVVSQETKKDNSNSDKSCSFLVPQWKLDNIL